MRIAYLISRYGREYIANETHGEIVRELQRLGVDVTVVSFGSRASRRAGFKSVGVVKTTGEYGEPILQLPLDAQLPVRLLNQLARPLAQYQYFGGLVLSLRRLLRHQRWTLLHVEGAYPLGAAVWLATRGMDQPYVVTTTGGDLFDLPHFGYGYGRFPLPRFLIRQTLRHAAWIRANSPMMQNLLCFLGADPRRITSIPVSIGDCCYPPADRALDAFRASARAALTEQYGWHEPRWVLSIGRLFNLKAPEQIILSAPEIVRRLGPTRFIIAGPSAQGVDGDYRANLEALAEREGVAPYVAFPGQITLEQVRQFQAAADLLVVPSLIEGLNRVTIEAAAVGTPTVITATAGAASLVRDYVSGVVVPPGEPGRLAQATIDLLGDWERREPFERGGLRFAADQRASVVARRLRDVYTAALGRHTIH